MGLSERIIEQGSPALGFVLRAVCLSLSLRPHAPTTQHTSVCTHTHTLSQIKSLDLGEGFFLHLYLLLTQSKTLVSIKIIQVHHRNFKSDKVSLLSSGSQPSSSSSPSRQPSLLVSCTFFQIFYTLKIHVPPLMSPHYTLFYTLPFPYNNPSEIIPYPFIYNCLFVYGTLHSPPNGHTIIV